MTLDLDSYDLKLLQALQNNARLSNVTLSEMINLSPSQCSRRLQRLEQSNLIKGYFTQLDLDQLGFNVMAFVSVTLEKHGENPAHHFHQEIQKIPTVLDCYTVTGDADYLLRVISPNLKAFSDFLMDHLISITSVSHVKSTVVLDQIKSSHDCPLPE